MAQPLELGLDTFGDVTQARDGSLISQAQALRDVVEEAVLAEQVGVDCFGVGEHHRPDFAISAPEVVLAAIATRTSRMTLGSAVTVLSTDDPVRVYERFSTLNALSNGRAEVILGRGSFTESYPLFGFDLSRYNELFEDRLALFVKLLEGGPVTWRGTTRSALDRQEIYPPIETGTLRTWVGVGGSPESVVRAAKHGLPLTLAIIGGSPLRFRPYVDLYLESLGKFGKPVQPVAVHSPGHIAETDAQAKEELWPHYEAMMTRIGGERGWPPTTRMHFENEAGPNGALCVGSPETVARKIATTIQALGLARFDMKYSAGTLPHSTLMKSIELFGTKVIPMVRDLCVRVSAVLFVLLAAACQQPEAQSAPGGPTRVSFESDGATLVGDIYMPDRIPRGGVPGVAVVHGSGTMPRAMQRYVVGPLNAMGVAVLAYDKRGVGESTGTYRNVGTADSVEALGQLAGDALNAARVLASHPGVDSKRVGLVGASQAGWIMPLAAVRDSRISFLVVISGPAVSVGYEILHGRLTNELNPNAVVVDPKEADRQLKTFSGPHGYDPAPTLAALKTPTLWLMGDRDINLPLKETVEALKALPQISNGVLTLIQYPDGDHQLARSDRSRVPYWDDVRGWLQKRGIVN